MNPKKLYIGVDKKNVERLKQTDPATGFAPLRTSPPYEDIERLREWANARLRYTPTEVLVFAFTGEAIAPSKPKPSP